MEEEDDDFYDPVDRTISEPSKNEDKNPHVTIGTEAQADEEEIVEEEVEEDDEVSFFWVTCRESLLMEIQDEFNIITEAPEGAFEAPT